MAVAKPPISPPENGTLLVRSCQTLERLVVTANDDHAVANAGLLLTATLAERLGAVALADELIDHGDRPGAAHAGSQPLRRWGRSRGPSPSVTSARPTPGPSSCYPALSRAWAAGAGPGDAPMEAVKNFV